MDQWVSWPLWCGLPGLLLLNLRFSDKSWTYEMDDTENMYPCTYLSPFVFFSFFTHEFKVKTVLSMWEKLLVKPSYLNI